MDSNTKTTRMKKVNVREKLELLQHAKEMVAMELSESGRTKNGVSNRILEVYDTLLKRIS